MTKKLNVNHEVQGTQTAQLCPQISIYLIVASPASWMFCNINIVVKEES